MADPNAAANQPQTARSQNMRYYENELPQVGEMVHVRYLTLGDNAAYVQLLEYANIQGIITFAELHRGRITSIAHYAPVGKDDYLSVLRLDAEKRYIDLTKKSRKPEDKAAGAQKAQQGRDVLNYMCTVSDSCQYPLDELMKRVAWPLAKKFPATDDGQQGGALAALKHAVENSDEVFGGLDIPANVRKELDRIVQLKLKPTARKFEAEVSVECKTVEGVESIKKVLMTGVEKSQGKVSITVKASPHYLMRYQSADRDEALKMLKDCIVAMEKVAETLSCSLEVDKPPCDVGASDSKK